MRSRTFISALAVAVTELVTSSVVWAAQPQRGGEVCSFNTQAGTFKFTIHDHFVGRISLLYIDCNGEVLTGDGSGMLSNGKEDKLTREYIGPVEDCAEAITWEETCTIRTHQGDIKFTIRDHALGKVSLLSIQCDGEVLTGDNSGVLSNGSKDPLAECELGAVTGCAVAIPQLVGTLVPESWRNHDGRDLTHPYLCWLLTQDFQYPKWSTNS
ncbi:hypothetical protein FOZ61_000291 [Perkinsus olseni]|uniref:Uncharacterized protein n=1 Tax=Perkinsus olseni TaxID=32597 RepID=A0A7J6KTG5_PEROL|nr:hypothetical protein FOZ61_000291 [Perkinsus olseni]KAF4651542.1 hypothetical protein FOL46_000258 [Perkinsus olseni]